MNTLADLMTDQHAYDGALRVLSGVASLVDSMPSATADDPRVWLPDAVVCPVPFDLAKRSVIATSLQDFLR